MTDASNGTEHDPLIEAREWIRERDAGLARVMGQVQAELENVEARAVELRSVLAQLRAAWTAAQGGSDEPSPTKPVRSFRIPLRARAAAAAAAGFDPKKATIGDAIAVAVARTPGMKSGGVVREVVLLKPGAKPTTIFPTIYRLREQGRVVKVGDKYYPPKKAPEEGEADAE